jgi:CitB family two-component system sensor histidine kinase MalK/two-component system sensor histidine kinase DctS
MFLRMSAWITLCLFLVLSIVTAVTLKYSLNAYQRQIDGLLMSTVESLANAAPIRNIIRSGVCHQDMSDYLTSVIENTDDLDYITLADANSTRIYFIDPDYIGMPFEGGDQHRALAGETYFSDANPENFEGQRRAFHPVVDDDGSIIGFVMASTTHNRIDSMRTDILLTYVQIFCFMTLGALAFTAILTVYLGRNLRGVRPEDLMRMYLTQSDVLNALDEGIVSFDKSGYVRLVNNAAIRMLGQRGTALLGRRIDDILLAEDGSSLQTSTGRLVQSNHPNILVQHAPLPDSNLWARQVLILADKSEIMRYTEELGGVRHMVNTLRANTHEFSNKLQVISGLLQMGQAEEAQSYISNLSSHYEQIVGPVMKYIRNSNVAALILGKSNHMRELNIELYLLNNSHLPEHSQFLSTEELVTVVGNLLENALEAINTLPGDAIRTVAMQLTEDDKGLLIMVSDTGPGIPRNVLPHIFKPGFSTKARTGRGMGMKLINDIVRRHGGTIDVDTDPGSGTTITIIFSREQGENL